MLAETGADGVMIGRAALGNPWLLYRTARLLRDGESVGEPTLSEKLAIALEHLDRLVALKGETVGVKEMRKHAGWYLKGLPQSARVRGAVNRALKQDELVAILTDYIYQLS